MKLIKFIIILLMIAIVAVGLIYAFKEEITLIIHQYE